MTNDTILTIVGNLTADPDLRFTPAGAAVTTFTVASTPRTYDRQQGEWKDGQALFMRCTVWRDAAENVADTLTRGTRVIVTGRLKQRSFETRDGEQRTVIELEVDEVANARFEQIAEYYDARRQMVRTGGSESGGIYSPLP